MTVIAYKDGIIASDKQRTSGDLKYSAIKLFEMGDFVIGCAGDCINTTKFRKWFKKKYGSDIANYPFEEQSEESTLQPFEVLVVNRKTLQVVEYTQDSKLPIEVDCNFIAIGTGRDFAMAAMYLGKSAEEAVQCAIDLCPSCGLGIDIVSMKSTK